MTNLGQGEIHDCPLRERVDEVNLVWPSEVKALREELQAAKEYLQQTVVDRPPEVSDANLKLVEPSLVPVGQSGDVIITGPLVDSEEGTSSLPEIRLIESAPGPCWKGKGVALVAEMDNVPQSVVKYGYLEGSYILVGIIYMEAKAIVQPVACGSGLLGKMCGWCIRDCQACITPKEFDRKEAKEEAKVKVKGKG
ncbi:hypothetical protein JB92DRAFT_2828164 [Gautieria morchelliformis]|nr:hypothetical protein JB92DRAFT_2828164 [Gautieria morchelliformis]